MVHKDVIIIGAGQCGLSVGRLLQKRGIDFIILEKNKQIGDNWRKRYDSLSLFTPASLSALPDLPMAIASKTRPNKNQIADYFHRYADHFDLPVDVNAEVREIVKENGLFRIETSRTTYTADQLVHAAGYAEKAYFPDWAEDLTLPYIHSNAYKSPVSIKGKKILLVGTGNSAAQIGAEIVKYYPIDWSPNKKPRYTSLHLLGSNILTIDKKTGRLDKPASDKTINQGEPIYVYDDLKKQLKKARKRKKVIQANGNTVTFEGGETETYDFILFATGFQPNFDFIKINDFEGDLTVLRNQQGVSQIPGLFFLGIPYQRSRSSQLIYGAQKDAVYIVDHLMKNRPKPLEE